VEDDAANGCAARIGSQFSSGGVSATVPLLDGGVDRASGVATVNDSGTAALDAQRIGFSFHSPWLLRRESQLRPAALRKTTLAVGTLCGKT
jgi:hypothetical protein